MLYGDYECPYTRKSLRAVHAVQERLGDQLRFVFRNFPLTEIHPHALQAAEAAEAAAAQGRFWEMHASLFAHQQALEKADLLQYAHDLGLDTAWFEQDLATHAHMERIKGDVESGLRSGVQGTPTFFINGVLHTASWEQDSLAAALQRTIAQSRTYLTLTPIPYPPSPVLCQLRQRRRRFERPLAEVGPHGWALGQQL